jgi:hypothetical protein
MQSITHYLDTPLTQALITRWGDKLDRMKGRTKLSLAHALMTYVGYLDSAETEDPNLMPPNLLQSTVEFGLMFEGEQAPEIDDAIGLVHIHQPTIPQMLTLVSILADHCADGVFADA